MEQAGIYKITLYENKGVSILYNSDGSIYSLENTGDTIEITNEQKPFMNITPNRSRNNKLSFTYNLNFNIYKISKTVTAEINQLKKSVYGWLAKINYYNQDIKFLNTPLFFDSSNINNNSANYYPITLNNRTSSKQKLITTYSLEDETIALLARMTVKPSIDRILLIDNTIKDLKEAGIWDKLDAFWFMNAHNQQAANLNWKENKYNLIPVNSPIFTVDEGYQGDGISSYLNTSFAPTDGINYSLFNSGYGVNSDTIITSSKTMALMGCYNTIGVNSISQILPNYSGDYYYTIDGENNSMSAITGSKIGLYSTYRNASNTVVGYLEAEKFTSNQVSSYLTSFDFFILARNQQSIPGLFADTKVNFAFVGAYLTEIENTQLRLIISNYKAGL
jgi:hypothetical protein